MLSLSETKLSATKLLISPVLASICLALMLLLHCLYPIARLLPFPFSLAGLLLSGLGLAICFTAHQQFQKIGTTLYPFSRPEKLVTDGLFRYTRNPMYLGLTLFLSGVWLFLGSLSPVVLVVAFLLVADRWYITYEEQRLLAVFGATYVAYRAETPRWIYSPQIRSQARKKKSHPPFPPHAETRYIRLSTGRCQACWACVQVCPQHVFGKVDFPFHRHARIDRAKNCQGCLRCLKACSNQAILAKEKPHDNTSR